MDRIWNEKLNEGLIHETLDNGIELYFYPKEGFTKKYAIFSTSFGSNHTHFKDTLSGEDIILPDGTAHFLEHKLFEEPEKNIFQKFAQFGANVNAYTNFDQTSYLFSTTDNFYESLSLLVEFVQNPYLTDENVEKEKGIIAQEIQMYDDNPRWRVFFNCLRGMYHNHPVRVDIAGTVESIMSITKEDLTSAYDNFYHPSNMVLFVVGDLEFEKIKDSVNSVSRQFDLEKTIPERALEEEPAQVKQSLIEDKMSTARPLFYLGYKDVNQGLSDRDSIKKDVATNIILSMMFSESSEFYQSLYSEGLIDQNFGAYYTGKSDYGHSFIVGQSEDPKAVAERVNDLFKSDQYLVEERFLSIKQKEIGGLLMGLNSVEFIANTLTDLYFRGFFLTDYLELLNEISFEYVKERYVEHFVNGQSTLSIVWPEQ
ncbi:MAG: pitrilysin family protein [Gudongella sp.]|nr:pitrilysin family protein [Gudongella sp.]